MPRPKIELNKHLYDTLKSYCTAASQQSLHLYVRTLERIYKELGFDNYDVSHIKDHAIVLSHFDERDITANTYINQLGSIIKYLLASGAENDIVDIYMNKIKEIRNKEDIITNKQVNNLITKEELISYIKLIKADLPSKIKDIDDLLEYQKYLCCSLHSCFSLSNDLADTKIYTIRQFKKISPKPDNYLLIYAKDNTVVFKIKKKGIFSQVYNTDLAWNIVKYFRAYRKIIDKDNHWFMIDANKDKLSRNDYTRFLNKTFENTGKNIGSHILQQIFML
jgi:site-specific recombinase XerD